MLAKLGKHSVCAKRIGMRGTRSGRWVAQERVPDKSAMASKSRAARSQPCHALHDSGGPRSIAWAAGLNRAFMGKPLCKLPLLKVRPLVEI